jgi:LysM repeat protein
VLERATVELPGAPPGSPAPSPTTGTQAGPTTAATLGVTAAPSFLRYRVQAGNTLASIAARFNIHTWELQLANPSVDFDHLVVGEIIYIPQAGQLTPAPS